jgi:hypothetical protein
VFLVANAIASAQRGSDRVTSIHIWKYVTNSVNLMIEFCDWQRTNQADGFTYMQHSAKLCTVITSTLILNKETVQNDLEGF